MMQNETIISDNRSYTVRTDDAPQYLLIQPADKRELGHIDAEVGHIKQLTDKPFLFAAFEVTDWNSELSPWEAPPVFGNDAFGSGAGETAAYIEQKLLPDIIRRYTLKEDIPVVLGGYSLAGLFALWAGYTSERFAAVAGVSPSVWFPGWQDFISGRSPKAKRIYLSLGRKEEKVRNQVMAAVGDNIRRQYEILRSRGFDVTLEWNDGNHFTEPDLRTAKGFARCIEQN